MASVRDSGLYCPGSSPGWGHRVVCVVFLGKTPSLRVALFTQVYLMGTSDRNVQGNPAMDQHPIQGRIEIFLVSSCHRNQDKLWPDEPLASEEEPRIHLRWLTTVL